MHPHYAVAILTGLAVGAIIGASFTGQIASTFPSFYAKIIFVS
jgi:hypothetical protein